MFVQVSTPRPLFDVLKYPEYVYIHTLRKEGVSTGEVLFGTVSHGGPAVSSLDPSNVYELHQGACVCEYIVPFWELCGPPERPILGALAVIANGFTLTAKSAYRSDFQVYEERVLGFKVLTSQINGGGILRMADSFIDLLNPTFIPWAEDPKIPKDFKLQEVYQETHHLYSPDVEERRLNRKAEVEAAMARMEAEKKSPALPAWKKPELPGGK